MHRACLTLIALLLLCGTSSGLSRIEGMTILIDNGLPYTIRVPASQYHRPHDEEEYLEIPPFSTGEVYYHFGKHTVPIYRGEVLLDNFEIVLDGSSDLLLNPMGANHYVSRRIVKDAEDGVDGPPQVEWEDLPDARVYELSGLSGRFGESDYWPRESFSAFDAWDLDGVNRTYRKLSPEAKRTELLQTLILAPNTLSPEDRLTALRRVLAGGYDTAAATATGTLINAKALGIVPVLALLEDALGHEQTLWIFNTQVDYPLQEALLRTSSADWERFPASVKAFVARFAFDRGSPRRYDAGALAAPALLARDKGLAQYRELIEQAVFPEKRERLMLAWMRVGGGESLEARATFVQGLDGSAEFAAFAAAMDALGAGDGWRVAMVAAFPKMPPEKRAELVRHDRLFLPGSVYAEVDMAFVALAVADPSIRVRLSLAAALADLPVEAAPVDVKALRQGIQEEAEKAGELAIIRDRLTTEIAYIRYLRWIADLVEANDMAVNSAIHIMTKSPHWPSRAEAARCLARYYPDPLTHAQKADLWNKADLPGKLTLLEIGSRLAEDTQNCAEFVTWGLLNPEPRVRRQAIHECPRPGYRAGKSLRGIMMNILQTDPDPSLRRSATDWFTNRRHSSGRISFLYTVRRAQETARDARELEKALKALVAAEKAKAEARKAAERAQAQRNFWRPTDR